MLQLPTTEQRSPEANWAKNAIHDIRPKQDILTLHVHVQSCNR